MSGQFIVGDEVEWASNGLTIERAKVGWAGYYHRGIVVRVLPAGTFFTNDSYSPRCRDHESYVVEEKRKRKPKLYWPIVSKLQRKDGPGHE